MDIIKIKGHEIGCPQVKDSYDRRAVQCRNTIIGTLKKLGIGPDDIDIELEPRAFKSAPATVSWYLDGHHLYYSYNSEKK